MGEQPVGVELVRERRIAQHEQPGGAELRGLRPAHDAGRVVFEAKEPPARGGRAE